MPGLRRPPYNAQTADLAAAPDFCCEIPSDQQRPQAAFCPFGAAITRAAPFLREARSWPCPSCRPPWRPDPNREFCATPGRIDEGEAALLAYGCLWLDEEKRASLYIKSLTFILVAATCFSVNCLGQSTAANLCAKDLGVIPGFLLENDTGAKDRLAQFGQKHFDDALAEARVAALQVSDADGCEEVLNQYVKAWRKGHLAVAPRSLTKPAAGSRSAQNAAAPPTYEPKFQILSDRTILLTLKSFRGENRGPLIELLRQNHTALAIHPNWIIDVRGNGGGSDSAYDPILAWLLPDEAVSVGALWLVTPANLQAHRNVCQISAPGDPECEKFMNDAVARMRNAPTGSLVPQDDSGGIRFDRQKPLEQHRPSRVAILIDGRCASSCEEFLLAARQSFNVKLIGRRTFGSLDVSNLRPFALPSGERLLWYATSRSLRIPDQPVDLAGIAPDIYLPLAPGEHAKEEEVVRVHSWLEGGTLAPPKTESNSKPSAED